MRTRYDGKHDIFYIDIAPDRKVHDTQPLDDDILIDLDEKGDIVGIEIWNASKNIVEPIAEQLMEKVRKSLEIVVK